MEGGDDRFVFRSVEKRVNISHHPVVHPLFIRCSFIKMIHAEKSPRDKKESGDTIHEEKEKETLTLLEPYPLFFLLFFEDICRRTFT